MIKKINHMSFTVSSVKDSIGFYTEACGLKLIDVSERKSSFAAKVTGLTGAHLKIAYFRGGNCNLELVEYIKPKGIKLDTSTHNIGSAHLCFDINDFLIFIENFKMKGGKTVSKPAIIPAGPNKGKLMVYGKDPDGNTLEFISLKRNSK